MGNPSPIRSDTPRAARIHRNADHWKTGAPGALTSIRETAPTAASIERSTMAFRCVSTASPQITSVPVVSVKVTSCALVAETEASSSRMS
mgnify:FL=1